MLLAGKTAIVYGAAGFVGGAVARAFAGEGATAYLAGRTKRTLDQVAEAIRSAGGAAEVAQVDVLDEAAVDQHAADVVAASGGIDIAFNAVTFGDVQGAALVDMPLTHATQPVINALRGQSITTRAVARSMVERGQGVMMTCTGYGTPSPDLGSTMVAWTVVEGLYRQLACDLGPKGVRVAWLRTGGFRESILGATEYDSLHYYSDGDITAVGDAETDESVRETLGLLEDGTMLKRLPTLAEAGAAAVYLASDHAGGVTATAINLTAGATVD